MTHKDLEVWKKAMELVTKIYHITSCFPKNEIYGLTSQIRRSAISIPSNIAEGSGRFHKNEFKQFLYIALGSLAELETQMIISGNLGFINGQDLKLVMDLIIPIRIMIVGLIKALDR